VITEVVIMVALSGTAGDLTRAELASQPEVWRTAAAASAASGVLPTAGEKALILGCGTSYYIGQAYARLRTAAGLGPTRAEIPSELDHIEHDETIVLLSRSGTTGDLVHVGRQARDSHRVVSIVGEAGTPIHELAPDSTLLLDFADEQSVMQTRFATASLTALRTSLGTDIAPISAEATDALTDALPLADDAFASLAHLVFLGSRWSAALAQEAALKVREAAGFWTEAYPLFEYQHGPISCASPNSLVWSFADVPDSVAKDIAATGAALAVSPRDPQAELVRVHRLAVALAAREDRDPDRPPHLSRSVTVTEI
jgi:fructoselysine-6-P-deglycase FrlB-like protein